MNNAHIDPNPDINRVSDIFQYKFIKMKSGAKSSTSSSIKHDSGHFNFHKLFNTDASWDKDQLGDVLHWIRQVVAIVCGLLWGSIPLVGGFWIILFLLISSGIVYGYYAIILKVDEEDFGGHGALLQEGIFVSITLFLLAWTLVYSLGHF